ncbi:MAG TPA: DUF559 domain-containing protein [Aestuariivirga sp.]|nr:DUF559 domain-containing protein [Aestuariivirga sp.]
MPNHFARHLRRNATDAERKLWQELRMLRNEGLHFRRQVPLGRYIADFACHGRRLIIELDGGQHGLASHMWKDAERSAELARSGYRVLRFWNCDVMDNFEGVVDMIRHAAGLETAFSYEMGGGGETPTPTPPHQGEGLNG